MKKLIVLGGLGLLLAAGAVFAVVQNDRIDPNSLLAQNIEALGDGEGGVTVTVCAALWGDCSINGATSKGPLVQAEF